jgi:7-carboxy-7-deazaguanine synthase
MLVSEIFLSIQGESTFAGLPCIFVRLAGCNLTCAWCDTPYAKAPEGARELSVDDVAREVARHKCGLVEITGGEPLMQADARALAERLLGMGRKVLIETNGSVCLAGLDRRIVKIVDVKCPGSGHAGSFLMENLRYITEDDEVKFVIGDRGDYEYAARFVEECVKDTTLKILFAPVKPSLDPKVLAEWILSDCLKVRLQIQVHKYIWGDERGR